MGKLTFKHGIHPNYHKEITQDLPIEKLPQGKEFVFPMLQHIGVPAVPIVKKGDYVYSGDLIGRADGFVSANIHSSVSGTVKAVEKRMTFKGVKELCVVIESDLLNTQQEHQAVEEPFTKEVLINQMKEMGVVGLGGATFPTHVKYSIPDGKEVDYILVNGAECEPYLTSDHRVLLERGEEVVKGLQLLLDVFPKAQGIIGIEDNKRDAYEHIKNLCSNSPIQVQLLHTKYPQGSEKQFIYALTQRIVPTGKLPIDVGCVVNNVDTIWAIYKAVIKNEPVFSRIITVSGEGVKKPCNLRVRLGTSFREVLNYAGVDLEKTVKIIAGGPMMGIAISDIDIPVTKATSAILCFTQKEVHMYEATSCISCGKCVEVCPMELVPSRLQKHADKERLEEFKKEYGMSCIECGCCSYICPAKRELVQSIRKAKYLVRNQQV